MVTRPAPGHPVSRLVMAAATSACAVVLLFAYPTSLGRTVVPEVVAAGTPAPATTPRSPVAPPVPQSTETEQTADGTYTGSVAQTRWGPVQVQITVAAGRVTAADALQTPSANRRDVEINARAIPVLDAEAVAAQDADIDLVSGATVTSVGYRTSLQAALDAAGR